MNFLELKYVRLVSSYLQGWKDVGNNLYRFRCPFCGDSKKNVNKARGYLFPIDDTMMYKCHNCQLPMPLGKFLAEVAPALAGEYRFERFTESRPNFDREEREKQTKFITSTKDKLKRTSIVLQTCERLLNLPEDHHARVYIEGRDIPEHHQAKLYYIDDVTKMTAKISGYEDRQLPPKDAIVIPFFDMDGVLMYLQCRFFDDKFRYMTFQVEEEGIKVWGLDRVEWDKPVYVCEGPFDAMFVENCVAVAGVSIMSIVALLKKHAKAGVNLIFDKDYMTNFEVFNQLDSAISQGLSVVLFDKEFPYKDINDQITKGGWTRERLMVYFRKRTMTGLTAKLEMSRVRPPKKKFVQRG